MNNKTNNNNKPVQFTELNPKDITLQEDLLIDLMVENSVSLGFSEENCKIVNKAKHIFCRTFG